MVASALPSSRLSTTGATFCLGLRFGFPQLVSPVSSVLVVAPFFKPSCCGSGFPSPSSRSARGFSIAAGPQRRLNSVFRLYARPTKVVASVANLSLVAIGEPMKRLFAALAAVILSAIATTAAHAEDLFDIKPIADGVYAAVAKPAYKVNCNAAIIMLGDSVLVVDTHSKPSAARALIEQIKKLTDKPVRYVVNTHFHWDHYQGNQAYPSSWPAGVEIISSEATRLNIEQRGIPRVKHEIATMPQEIEKLKTDLAAANEPKQKDELRRNLSQAEDYFAELKSMQVTLPTLTFDHSLILRRKSRTVEMFWLG